MEPGVGRQDLDGLVDESDGLDVMAGLVSDDAEQMEGIRVARRLFDDGFTYGLCRLQLPRAMESERLLELCLNLL